MFTSNKETKNKASILKIQLITVQHVFVVKTYYKASSYLEVKEAFRERFLDKVSPRNRRAWKNVEKYDREGAKVRCNRRRTVKIEETIEVVRSYMESNATNVSCRCNGLQLSHSTFTKIIKLSLTPRFLRKCKE